MSGDGGVLKWKGTGCAGVRACVCVWGGGVVNREFGHVDPK